MEPTLTGKRIVITCGSAGIGFATAGALGQKERPCHHRRSSLGMNKLSRAHRVVGSQRASHECILSSVTRPESFQLRAHEP